MGNLQHLCILYKHFEFRFFPFKTIHSSRLQTKSLCKLCKCLSYSCNPIVHRYSDNTISIKRPCSANWSRLCHSQCCTPARFVRPPRFDCPPASPSGGRLASNGTGVGCYYVKLIGIDIFLFGIVMYKALQLFNAFF